MSNSSQVSCWGQGALHDSKYIRCSPNVSQISDVKDR